MTALFPLADFTPAQAERRDRIEAAPEPPEITVERVARALRKVMETEHPADGISADEWLRHLATAATAAMPAHPAEEAVLVEGDWVIPIREAHARDLTKSWADAAQNAGCPAAFVARMRSFVEVHDRNYRAAIAAPQTGEHATDEEGR